MQNYNNEWHRHTFLRKGFSSQQFECLHFHILMNIYHIYLIYTLIIYTKVQFFIETAKFPSHYFVVLNNIHTFAAEKSHRQPLSWGKVVPFNHLLIKTVIKQRHEKVIISFRRIDGWYFCQSSNQCTNPV